MPIFKFYSARHDIRKNVCVIFTNNYSSFERIDLIYYLALMKEIYQPVPLFRISIHTGDASKLLYLLLMLIIEISKIIMIKKRIIKSCNQLNFIFTYLIL